MPPSRRRGPHAAATPISRSNTTTAASSNQPTLSFGAKSRVTKPTTSSTAAHIKGKAALLDSSATATVPSDEGQATAKPHVAEVVVREQAKTEIQQPLSEEDERALKISTKELQRYWKLEEEKRKAPRVHQQDLTLEEKILRHFDLSSQYGPCIGIARLKRWRRANMLSLNPPIEVLAVLLKDKGETKQRAYVDELMS